MDKRPQLSAKNKTDLMPNNASCKRWDTPVGIFLACGNLPHPLFAQVFWGKVETTRIAPVRQHGGQSACEAEWVIEVFAQDSTGIGRQPAPIEGEANRFGPNWRQMQQ